MRKEDFYNLGLLDATIEEEINEAENSIEDLDAMKDRDGFYCLSEEKSAEVSAQVLALIESLQEKVTNDIDYIHAYCQNIVDAQNLNGAEPMYIVFDGDRLELRKLVSHHSLACDFDPFVQVEFEVDTDNNVPCIYCGRVDQNLLGEFAWINEEYPDCPEPPYNIFMAPSCEGAFRIQGLLKHCDDDVSGYVHFL